MSQIFSKYQNQQLKKTQMKNYYYSKKDTKISFNVFYVFFAFILSSTINAQVGINTANPLGTFHVDGSKDNPTTGTPSTTQQANDLIVTSTGNVGIGTTTPTRKLEIVSPTSPALRIKDGNQHVNYVLMSDADGYGTWKALSNAITATFPAAGFSGAVASPATGTVNYTGVTLTLPPGKWLILTNVVLNASPDPANGKGAWVRLQWSTSSTSQTGNFIGQLNSGMFIAPYGNAIGSTLTENTTSTDQTYYLMVGSLDIVGGYVGNWNNIGGSQWTENSIIAYPAN